jgi:glutathione synthase
VSELAKFGVDWVAFDILGDSVQEVNITCPGLLVEVSFALRRNLADVVLDLMKL